VSTTAGFVQNSLSTPAIPVHGSCIRCAGISVFPMSLVFFAKQVLKACLVNVGLYSVWNTSGSAIWVVLHVVYVCIFIGFMLSYKPAAGKAQSKYMFM